MTAQPLSLPATTVTTLRWPWLASAAEMAGLASGNWPLLPDPSPRDWTCFPRIATRTPGTDARSVGAARDFTRAILRQWGVPDRAADIAVVVSELLTNAVRHALADAQATPARSPIRLGLLQPGPYVLCAVADPGRRAPVPREPDHLGENGRGLHVIDALSDAWGYTTPDEAGKVVWAMFSTSPAMHHAHSHPGLCRWLGT